MSEATSDPRSLLSRLHHGVLSTHSAKEAGYPYGSVLPFCLDASGAPLFLISELAQHTRNLQAEPKASLTLFEGSDSDAVQAGARLVLLGEVEFLGAGEAAKLAPRYYRYLPSAPDYRLLTDFRFARLKLHKAHFIAGFGQIRWLEPEALRIVSPLGPDQENAMIEDLNTREEALLETLWHRLTSEPAEEPVALVGIDGLGGDLRQGARLLRFRFMGPVLDAGSAWHRLHEGEVSLEA